MSLHKFVGPRTTAVTIDTLGENLPFELGPWKSVGAARIPEEHDPQLMREVEACGYGLRARPASELVSS